MISKSLSHFGPVGSLCIARGGHEDRSSFPGIFPPRPYGFLLGVSFGPHDDLGRQVLLEKGIVNFRGSR